MLLHRIRLNLRRKMRCDTAYPQHWWGEVSLMSLLALMLILIVYFLRQQGGGYVIILSVCLSVNLWADYWKSNEPISLKLGVMIGSTNQRYWLTFSGALVPDTDSGSFTKLGRMTNTDKIMNPNILGESQQTSGFGLIQQSGFESGITFGWNVSVGGGLCSVLLWSMCQTSMSADCTDWNTDVYNGCT